MKELARLWPKAINQPVVVLHPMLFVAQQPVVKSDQFRGEMMRFFDSAHHADGVRFTFHKAFDPRNDRRRRRAMTAAGVRRDDENFWSVGVHLVAQAVSLRSSRKLTVCVTPLPQLPQAAHRPVIPG